MATKADKTKTDGAKLTPAQLMAIDQLAIGASVTATADACKVARQTVSEWLNQNHEFQAALNQRRSEIWNEQLDRYRTLLPKALDTIETVLSEGGSDAVRAALTLLKLANFNPGLTGSTDPNELSQAQKKRQSDLFWGSLDLSDLRRTTHG
jgi:hypothetical protein